MIFEIHSERNASDKAVFLYDNETNTLSTQDGFVFEYGDIGSVKAYKESKPFSKDNPLVKSKNITLLKIQLGLSCNYSCDYCSQRFVERPKETSKKDIDAFMEKLENLEFKESSGLKIEFWGGEPFVYWKTFKPLVAALKEKFKDWQEQPRMSVITNGSLLNPEICDWLYDNGFSMAISHDALGQGVRGEDPFDDPTQKAFVLKFYRRMRKENRISFNAMLNVNNMSRKAIHDWFVDFTGDINVPLGEGGMIDAYDADGIKNSLQTKADHFKFRKIAFKDIYENNGDIGFNQIIDKIDSFTDSVLKHRPASTVGQKCGMEKENTLAIDLRGDVITCQNTSTVETSMNGESHKGGNIEDMDSVVLKTATHWRNRKHCSNCPVIHICQGSCMYLDNEYWETSCAGAYSDAIALFALSLEKITGGYIPVFINNPYLPDDRKDIWGTVLEHKETVKKSFPIKVVTQKKIEVEGNIVYAKSELVE